MSSRHTTAANRLFALIAALTATLAGPTAAHAQDDPFALPKGVTARSVAAVEGPGLSEIVVDGQERKRMVDLTWKGEDLLLDADAARAAGLPVPDEAKGKIALNSLKIAKWTFDGMRQRLAVALFRKSDGDNLIDLYRPPDVNGEVTPLTAVRVDYDLTATAGKGGVGFGGFIETAVVRDNFSAGTGIQLVGGAGKFSAKRLDSKIQVGLPAKGMTVTAGDFVSAGGQSQRALRLGGLQLASDFELRPDLVTIPLPAFSGQVAVPTGIDVISGDQRVRLGEVEAGEFTVRNLPSSTGRGEISVLLRDGAGREVVQNTRFYVSRSLLAPGLSQYAVNAGFVRRRYGDRSFDYSRFAASAFYRRGLSPFVTLEGSGEWTAGTGNFGGRADFIIAALAQASVEGRVSRDSRAGTGAMVSTSLESVGQGFNFRLGGDFPSTSYRDVASRLGDPAPPRQYYGQVSFDLRQIVRAQISVARQERRLDPAYPFLDRRSDVLDLSLRSTIKKFEIFASGSFRRGDRGKSFALFAGVSKQFGGGRSAYATVNQNQGRRSYQAAYRKFAREPGDIGYSAEAAKGPGFQRVAGSATTALRWGRIELQAEEVNGDFAARANARGTLIMAKGKVFARNNTSNNYALVTTTGKVDGVTILRENRAAGTTSRGGILLVEDLPQNAAFSIDVDGKKLPLDALARATDKRVFVPRGAVGLVELDVVRFRPVMRQITDAAGQSLPVGTPVVTQPSNERTMVGYDGLVEINVAGGDERLLVGSGANRCEVDLRAAALTDAAEGPPMRCVSTEMAALE